MQEDEREGTESVDIVPLSEDQQSPSRELITDETITCSGISPEDDKVEEETRSVSFHMHIADSDIHV